MLSLTITADDTPERSIDLGAELLRGEGITIGRSSRCGVVIDHPTVSRSHARLQVNGERVRIIDLGSTSGSSIGGIRLAKDQPRELNDGDMVIIGAFTLLVKIGSEVNDTTLASTTMGGEAGPEHYMPLVTIAAKDLKRWDTGEIPVRCVRITDETHDVKTFAFAAEPPVLFTYQPGQFATLNLAIDGKPIKRSYTISSSPSRPHLLTVTVKRVPAADGHLQGLVSNWLHDHLAEGDRISISGPYGDFTCAKHPSAKLLLISAGSGVTPMLSMSRFIHDTASQVDVVFVHSARAPKDLIGRNELEQIARENPNFRLVFTTSRPEPFSAWSGLTGRLSIEMLNMTVSDLHQRRVFVCGPDSFMRGVKEMLQNDKFPMDHFHEESFGGPKKSGAAAPVKPAEYGLKALLKNIDQPGAGGGSKTPATGNRVQSPGAVTSGQRPAVPAVVAATPAKSDQICFKISGKSVVCTTGDSILEIAEANGVGIPSACRMGKCGTCKTVKRKGDLHRDGYDDAILSAADRAAGYILTCIGKARGSVEVEA